MGGQSPFGDIKSRIRDLGIHVVHILVDSIFLALWLIVQYGLNYLVRKFQPSGIEYWVLMVFQVAFAISTLVPVIIYIWIDLRIMKIRASRIINQEIQNEATGHETVDH